MGTWANQTGGGGLCAGVGSIISGVVNAGAQVWDTSMTNKSNTRIGAAQNQTNICISKNTNATDAQIGAGNNLASTNVAEIQGQAGIQEAQIAGEAAILAAKNQAAVQPINGSTVALIFVGVLVVTSIVGIFYFASKKA